MNDNLRFDLGSEWTSSFSSPEATFYIHSRTLGTCGTVSRQVNNLGIEQKTIRDPDALRTFIVNFVSSQGCGSDVVKEGNGTTADGEFTMFAIEDKNGLQTILWFVHKAPYHALIVYMNSEGVDQDEMKHVENSVVASTFKSTPWWKVW